VRYLRFLFIFVVLAFVAEFVLHNDLMIFIFSAIGLIPLAGMLGEATEELSLHTGPKIGGLLNATLGNAAELIITIVAINGGKMELVKASITGSILGNVLLILGASLLLGGLKNGTQRFSRGAAGTASTLMLLSVIGMLIPTLFEIVHRIKNNQSIFGEIEDPSLNTLSLGVAAVLILMYVLSLIYSFRSEEYEIAPEVGVESGPEEDEHKTKWDVKTSVGILAASTIAIVFLSEFLVGAVEPVVHQLHVSELFLGIILIPIVGNVAEHIVGVQMAYKNKMELSMAISLGSSMQIALFVAPLLVFISILFGEHMTLYFNPFEVVILALSVIIAGQIASDGESNWLEGAQLLVVYVIAAMGFFLL
jgi:Ca2+:H+ antiporter